MARTYQMTPAQNDDLVLGGAAQDQVEQEIAADLQDAGIDDDVDVLCDDGAVAWTLWHPEHA